MPWFTPKEKPVANTPWQGEPVLTPAEMEARRLRIEAGFINAFITPQNLEETEAPKAKKGWWR